MDGIITCVCPTFNRPELLGRAIRAFEKQTYENKFMVIIDDTGQYNNQKGDCWELISIPRRVLSLGEKRNIGASLAPKDTWAYAVWDDDDLYMPWHLEALAEALTRGEFVQPRMVVDFWGGEWVQVQTFGAKNFSRKSTGRPVQQIRPARGIQTHCYHGCWGYTRKLFEEVGGYPPRYADDDGVFQKKIIKLGKVSVGFDPAYPPSYFYNRQLENRISEKGKTSAIIYHQNKVDVAFIGEVPKWQDESEWDQKIPDKIIERPW